MPAKSLFFTGPEEVAVRREPIPDPPEGEVLVETEVSAISPGTELLIYRGEAPVELAADEEIDALSGGLDFPLAYGYAAVGRVTAVGAGVGDDWQGRRVFAFHPHRSHVTTAPENLVALPPDCPPEVAAFLANAECAVNFAMDGRPTVGERVAVFGQGVVGLLTAALLAEYPLAELLTVDLHERRRELGEQFGADETLSPEEDDVVDRLRGEDRPRGPDLAYELTGDPGALDTAVAASGFHTRLIVGSWYGSKPATLDLGGRFHRDRVRLQSSQVSTVAPPFRGRWSKKRRLDVAIDLLTYLDPTGLITHRFPVERAAEAYRLLDERPEDAVQVLLTYD